MLKQFDGREIEANYIVEITNIKPYIEFRDERVGMDVINRPTPTGDYFFSLIIVGTDAIHYFDKSKEKLENLREEIKKEVIRNKE